MKKRDVIEYLKKNPQALKDEFVIRRNAKTVRKTFEVEEALVRAFMEKARGSEMKIKDAIDQALRNWIGK